MVCPMCVTTAIVANAPAIAAAAAGGLAAAKISMNRKAAVAPVHKAACVTDQRAGRPLRPETARLLVGSSMELDD